jgi:hypothetical protein
MPITILRDPVTELVIEFPYYGAGLVRKEKRKKGVDKTGGNTNRKPPCYRQGIQEMLWIGHSHFARMFVKECL